MRLSEAIRLGAMLRPQARFSSLTPDGRTCALGAALDAIGKATHLYAAVLDYFPTASIRARHPLTTEEWWADPRCVMFIVRSLNDEHLWTREQIADWVATLEPAEPEVEVVAPAASADPVEV